MHKLYLPFLLTFCSLSALAQNSLSFNNLTLHDQSQTPKYNLAIHYPQIVARQLTPAERKFNALMQEKINQAIENFKQTVRENEKYPIPSEIKANGSSISIDYQVVTINKSFVSVRYGVDTSFAGAAHPTHTYQTLNYDLSLNKEINLGNLFQPNSNYLHKIADYSNRQLKSKLKAALFPEGISATPKNYQVWNIIPKGLRITFNEYQAAAYVYGPQQVIIPYAYLKNMLSEKTSLAKCLKTQLCQIKIIHSPKQEIKYQ